VRSNDIPLPPSFLFVEGRKGRGWHCVFSSDLRCSPGIVMTGHRAVDRPSRLVPGPSRLAFPSPLPPFARSSASIPPRRDFVARRARATVRASTVELPMYSMSVRTSASGRRPTPRHPARRSLRSALSLPPLWLLGICRTRHLCRLSSPYESARVWGDICCCAADC
jgi:hypothetical protein